MATSSLCKPVYLNDKGARLLAKIAKSKDKQTIKFPAKRMSSMVYGYYRE